MERRIRKTFIVIAMIFVLLAATVVTILCAKSCDEKGTVTVTFVTNGGNEISPVKLKKGEKYTLPEAEKDGLIFSDWYYDEKFENVCPETITAEKDETLYARYGAVLTFETSGGTEIERRIYFEGERIGSLPASYKDGFSFGGWYYDAEYDKIVGKTDRLERSVTVYAKFSEKAEAIRKSKSVRNVSSMPTVRIKTDGIVLHNDNLTDYMSFVSSGGEVIEINCRPVGSDYIVEPAKSLDEGMTFFVKSLSSSVKFLSVDGTDTESADELTITTHKEEKEIIKKKPTVHLSSLELAKWEENVYVYMDAGLEKNVNRVVAKTTKDIKEGAIVTIGESEEETDDDYICKVISVEKQRLQYVVGTQLKDDVFVIMEVVTPNVDDIYYEIDVYGEREAELEGIINLSADTVAENVARSEGLVMLGKAVGNAVSQSRTVANYAKSLPSDAERAALQAAIGGFKLRNPKVRVDISGSVLAFEIEVGGEIQVKNIKISVSVTIKNSTRIDYRYTICKSRLVTLNPLLWFYTDVKVDLTNDFSIALAATVEFADSDDDIHGIIDITDEVEDVMDIAKDGQNKFAEAITGSPLWDDESELEYADLFSIPLGQIPLPVPVVSLMIEFNVVGSLGARAGLYVEFSHHYVETTTLTNGEKAAGENGKPVMFKEFKFVRATAANEIDLSITLKGQVGFRCGLEVKLSLSIANLNSVAAAYVSFRFGPYIELSGLVSFRYSYDVVNKASETHLYGGMYLEVGLFVNAKIGAKFLVYDVNTDLFDKKIPLYGVGDRLIPLGFVEETNLPDQPFVITSRYGGVRMSTAEMRYLDIVTGEEVVDNASRNRYGAYLDYEFEFYDVPDYQTKDYKKYVEIKGRSTLISRSYPYKSLKFAVKAKLLPRQGVYASGIERIFYVEYRNPDGRDYATQFSEFRNEYYVGGGSTHSELLEKYAFMEGEQVVPPDFTAETLPVRQGYYLDMNDLWEKYFPFLDDKIDEDFDGTFPIVTYENATVIYKGYLISNTCYYRLKWKRCAYTAKFYYPEYESADVVSGKKLLVTAQMIYVPSLRYFVVLTDKITAPDISGKKYSAFESSCGLSFTNGYFQVNPEADGFRDVDISAGSYPVIPVDVNSDLYLGNFEGIRNGAEFIATYTDENVFTETYVLETETVKRIKVEYKPFNYQGKTIRPIPPASFGIGEEFTANGNTYVIKGYRDINPESEENSRYYDPESMPDVTKNRIYYLLYERKGYEYLPVYYVGIFAQGVQIGDYGVKQGEEINIDLLKANFDDKTVIAKLAGYPRSSVDEVIESCSVVWDVSAVPARMPDNDITINLEVTYKYKELTAEFRISDPLQSFADDLSYETRSDGETEYKAYIVKGKAWTFGSEDESAFYSFPGLNDYFDDESKKYYAFYGWTNADGEVFSCGIGIRTAFVKSVVYTPLFVEKEVLPTIAFLSVGDYGYEYYYRIVSGDYFGKTLAEVIIAENVTAPERGDVNDIFEYEFIDWGVDANAYEIGTEKDSGGNVKTNLVFKARFSAEGKRHSVTFDALGGCFADGEKTFVVTDIYGTDVSYVLPQNYSDEKGNFTFVCWTTVPYSPECGIHKEDLKIGNASATYYAYYSLDPATITLTFRGKVETEEADGSGNVYFDGVKSKTELKVSDLYGRSYYITANDFAVDSRSKTFVPDYLKWTAADGSECVSAFYNDGYVANVPFDCDATVEIVFKAGVERIVNVAFVSDGECFEPDGEKISDVICKGYMSGLRHVVNYFETYGTEISVPYVEYYSENYYRFDRFETKPDDNTAPVSVKSGEIITLTDDVVFYGVYVHDTESKVQLTFRADAFSSAQDSASDDLVGLKIFPDGSVEINDFGTSGEYVSFNKTPSCKGMEFVGWTTDGKNVITAAELLSTTYSMKTTYYAVYRSAPDTYKVTVNAGDGRFGGGENENVFEAVPFGRLTTELGEKPIPNAIDLVFSHYVNEDGCPVTAITKEETLYAKYARPVSSFEELLKVNLAPGENYVLTNDVVAGGKIYDESNRIDWTAIGSGAPNGFSGTFNGNGYKISVSAKKGTKDNFGLFGKISGTVYNLSLVGDFSISGSTDATALGAFAGEVTESGRIIDCHSFVRFTIDVSASQKLSASGAVGINNGLIDGLMSSAGGEINIDCNKEFNVGATVGTNNGRMKNVNQSGRGGAVSIAIERSLNCNVGSFAGCNNGSIENSFAERGAAIRLSQGDNVYLGNSVKSGGFVGRNDGTITNASILYGKLEFSVGNLTLCGKSGLELVYSPYDEVPKYIAYSVGKDAQGVTYTTEFIIYLDENATKTSLYREYTLSEFEAAYPTDAKKFNGLVNAVTFGSFVSSGDDGKTVNCSVVEKIGTGNGDELVSGCGFDEIKWSYLSRMHDNVYGE